MNIRSLINELQANGIAVVNEKLDSSELIEFANKFGTVVPDDNGIIVQDVLARDLNNGSKGSFSYTCGYGEFPYHIDTAFWELPARYLVLRVTRESDCQTHYTLYRDILNLSDIDLTEYIKRACFILKTFNGQRFVPFVFSDGKGFGYRYDPNILIPYNKEAKLLVSKFDELLKKSTPSSIKWSGDNFAIIDNWKGVHSRGTAFNDKNRVLNRIYVR